MNEQRIEELAQAGFEAACSASWTDLPGTLVKQNWRNAVRAILIKLRRPITSEGKTLGEVAALGFGEFMGKAWHTTMYPETRTAWENSAQAVLSVFDLARERAPLPYTAEELANAVWDAHFGYGSWNDSVRRNLNRDIRNSWIVALTPFCQPLAKPTPAELRQMAAEQGMELVCGVYELRITPDSAASVLTRQLQAPDARFGRPECK